MRTYFLVISSIFSLVVIATLSLIMLRMGSEGAEAVERILAVAPSYLLLFLSISLVLAVVSIAVYLVYFLIKIIIVKLFSSESLKAASATQKLIALAGAVFVFPSVFIEIYNRLLRVAVELFLEVPRAIAQVAIEGMSCIQDQKQGAEIPASEIDVLGPCIAVFISSSLNALTSSISGLAYRSGLLDFDIRALVFAIVTFVVISIGLARISSHMTDRSRFWLGYAFIAVFSIYLALSATLAVPLMQEGETQQPNLTAEQLRESLNQLVASSNIDMLENGVESTEDQTVVLADSVAPLLSKIEENIRDEPISFEIAEIRRIIEQINLNKNEIDRRLSEIQERIPASINSMIDSAVELYRTETLNRLGRREASRHYLDIRSWFSDMIISRERTLASCQRSADEINRLQARARQYARNLATLDGEVVARRIEREMGNFALLLRDASAVSGACQTYESISFTPPARAVYGSSLGLVGVATGWLLGAESMPVTLITGLVGYGLLGALASRFVRTDPVAKDMEDIGQIAVVVFSGFVAALVVYVAAYGGIAIASEEGGNPNPYVVFGACLVGAVYSTDVWERARERVLQSNT